VFTAELPVRSTVPRSCVIGFAALGFLGAGCGLDVFPYPMPAVARDDAGGRGGRRGTSADAGPPDVGAAPPSTPPATSVPTSQGAAIVVDGAPVPKEKIVVFLHIGHSNMAGRTSTPPELRPQNFETAPHLWAYAKGGAWRAAKEPLSGDYLTKSNAGPGMSILHTALALAPQLHFVSIGRGHDGSIGGYCRNFRKGALLYDYVMVPAMELKGKVTFGAIFTMLGVNEFRRDLGNLPRFHECLEGIASDMRADLGDPNIPFLLGDWEAGATGDFDPTHDYAIATRAQMRLAIMNIPRAALIPSEMLPMSDDHHYDLTGYKLWAERGFMLMKAGGLIPWAAE
jgi:hypothetical protein